MASFSREQQGRHLEYHISLERKYGSIHDQLERNAIPERLERQNETNVPNYTRKGHYNEVLSVGSILQSDQGDLNEVEVLIEARASGTGPLARMANTTVTDLSFPESNAPQPGRMPQARPVPLGKPQ